MNYLTRSLDLAKDLANPSVTVDTKSDKEDQLKINPVPNASAIRQWGVKAQENLTHYQDTGELPKNLFLLD